MRSRAGVVCVTMPPCDVCAPGRKLFLFLWMSHTLANLSSWKTMRRICWRPGHFFAHWRACGVDVGYLWTANHSNRNKHFSNELCDICFWGFSLLFTSCWCQSVSSFQFCSVYSTSIHRALLFIQFKMHALPLSNAVCFGCSPFCSSFLPQRAHIIHFVCHSHTRSAYPAPRARSIVHTLLSTQQNNKCG